MFTINSQTISEDYKAEQVPLLQWKFQIENENTGSMIVSDPLLDTLASATERANAEFLKNSYKIREVNFSTYRTDITKNMVISVRGLDYLVRSIMTSKDEVGIKTRIRGERYE